MSDDRYMKRALELAAEGKGKTGANPIVGAVIVKDGCVIGEGYHHYFGGDHAEIDALKNVVEPVKGGELFVTLEPCAHFGKTPPCTAAIIESGIAKVFAAMVDPNPMVAGKGIAALRNAGIEVAVGMGEEEAKRQNESYIKLITTGMPFVTAKIAQTLDGKIAGDDGNSKWITSEDSRREVHRLRSEVDAVLIGGKTARLDDPALTSHRVSERNPLRLVLSRQSDLSRELQLVTENSDGLTVLLTTAVDSDSSATEVSRNIFALEPALAISGSTAMVQQAFQKSTADVKTLPPRETIVIPSGQDGFADITALLRELGKRQISRLLVEGGSKVFSAFIEEKLVDKYIFVIAPKLLGSGLSGFQSQISREIGQSVSLRFDSVRKVGDDLWIEAYPR